MRIGIRQQAMGSSKRASVFRFSFCAMLFALCFSAAAQQPGKIFRIGFLDGSTNGVKPRSGKAKG
jgi:hypothetical protein